MTKTIVERDMVMLPKEEYRILKELYKTVKRQNFLLRLEEAEKNLKAGKIRKVSVKDFRRRCFRQALENAQA
ncbi:MAG TPA: hypothetical protein VN604_11915 [Nitrospirota bacterium]|nr:hypothetical protein [Nitrospirota bacterium]